MIKTKFNSPISILLLLMLVTGLYVYGARELLQSVNDDIEFVEHEIKGLTDYESVISIYFNLRKAEQGSFAVILEQSVIAKEPYLAEALNMIEQATSEDEKAKALRTAIRLIGDDSNLILDPSLQSYYATSILFVHVPKLIELVHRQAIIGEAESEGIQYAISLLTKRELDADRRLQSDFDALKQASVSEKGDNIDIIRSISDHAARILSALLHKRLDALNGQRSESILIMIAVYFSLIISIGIALRNYVNKIEMKATRDKAKLLEKLAAKNSELEEFTYAAAHDLKEPIRTMRCYATLLQREVAPLDIHQAPFDEYVGIIEKTSGRAESLINDLLGYRNLSNEAVDISACDCNAELEQVIEDLKYLIESTKANITYDILPTINAVPSLFRRVLLNLIDNAIKYRDQDARPIIEITANRVDGDWVFSVADNGMGIETEHKGLVFEPFKRLYPREFPDGTGIGLTSCRKMLELVGGKIWVVDSDCQAGTIISFSIPAI